MAAWIDQIFKSKMAKKNGIVRRKLSSIRQYSSEAALKAECKKRGFHIVEHGDQWLIFCDPDVRFIQL